MDDHLQRHINKLFTGRSHLIALCSRSGTLALPPQTHDDTQTHEAFEAMPEALRATAVIGLVPFVVVEWDLIFDRDVRAEELIDHIADLQVRGGAVSYHFRTFYFNPTVASAMAREWGTLLGQEGRRVRVYADDAGKAVYRFDCRKAEKFFCIYLAREPAAGRRLSA